MLCYGVAQRRYELGIRLALGAQRADILRLVVRQGFDYLVAHPEAPVHLAPPPPMPPRPSMPAASTHSPAAPSQHSPNPMGGNAPPGGRPPGGSNEGGHGGS